jgi:N-acyl-D-amino-acid deacylase
MLLRGGRIPAPGGLVEADILVAGGRIAAIGGDLPGPDEIPVSGQLVLPGFVDAHVHGEVATIVDGVHLPALHQGVTTYIVGQDGTSIGPGTPATRAALGDYFAGVNGDAGAVDIPGDMAGMLDRYDGASTVNVAFLVGNGNLRHDVLGTEARPALRAELDRMREALDVALGAGAVGLSSGLDYIPSGFATTDELAALCEVVAAHDKVYVTHMRGYGRHVRAGMDEVLEIASRTGVKVHVSHFSGAVGDVLPHVDAALEAGVDLTFDTYPFTAGSSILHMYVLPRERQAGGTDAVLEWLSTPGGARAAAALVDARPELGARLRVAGAPGWEWAEGLTLDAVAERAGGGLGSVVVELLTGTRLRASVVESRDTFDLRDTWLVRQHPAHMTGSDGIFAGGAPHPRGWATFATLVREQLDGRSGWSWPELVDHLSARACRRFGLAGGGVLEVGAIADLVVIDPDRLRPRATYASSRELAVGVTAVLVGGELALAEGRPTGRTPGRGIRALSRGSGRPR